MLAWRRWMAARAPAMRTVATAPRLHATVALLPAWAHLATGALRVLSRGGLLVMAAVAWLGDGALLSNTLALIRSFAIVFLAPEAVAGLLLQAFVARAALDGDRLVFVRGEHRIDLPVHDIAAVGAWRLPVPAPGAWLQLRSGERWRYGIAGIDAAALAAALAAAGGPAKAMAPGRLAAQAQAARSAARGRLSRPWAKFGLLPLVLAVPAFRLHQHIAYGDTLGEYYGFGLAAYVRGFALWWAAWAIGVVLCAAVLRAAIEAGVFATAALRPQLAGTARRRLEGLGLAALYLGLPAWLLLRLAGV
jgi:apolipoprotein N-acyltransferase